MFGMANRKRQEEQRAIDILEKQIGKLNDDTYPASDLWAVQTATFVKTFFGESSDEYKHISSVRVRDQYKQMVNWNKQQKDSARLFVKQCIQTIERIGLYQPPKSNIFRSLGNDVLIPSLLTVLGGTYFIGSQIGAISANNERDDLKKTIIAKNDTLNMYRQAETKLKARIKALQAKPDTAN